MVAEPTIPHHNPFAPIVPVDPDPTEGECDGAADSGFPSLSQSGVAKGKRAKRMEKRRERWRAAVKRREVGN